MARVGNAVASKKRKKRVLKAAKGQFGHRSRRYQQAKRSVQKGLTYHFRDRKVRKREFRSLWIIRINAACQEAGLTYSRFMKGLKNSNVMVNRKMISELAINSPEAFNKLVDLAKNNLNATNGSKKTSKAKTAKA